MKIIVTGGRHSNRERELLVWKWLDNLLAHLVKPEDLTIAQGGATGVDKFTRDWCMMRGVSFVNYPYLSEFGNSGGRLRNQAMLESFRPHFVVAFPGQSGTEHMKNLARSQGYMVVEVKDAN